MTDPRMALTLDEVEQRLFDLYHWFHREAPDVYPNPDEGEIGALWGMHDHLVRTEES